MLIIHYESAFFTILFDLFANRAFSPVYGCLIEASLDYSSTPIDYSILLSLICQCTPLSSLSRPTTGTLSHSADFKTQDSQVSSQYFP